jgi:hypothetical protein
MVSPKIAVLTIALCAFAAPAAFGQAAIQEPGAFEFYYPTEDVLNGGAPSPEAALVSTTRTRNAYAAIHSGSLRADFNKLSARQQVGTSVGRSWCLHDYVNDNVDCSYSNRSQCAATASGGLGECSTNR